VNGDLGEGCLDDGVQLDIVRGGSGYPVLLVEEA
jgi:hypothetical protein